MSKETSQTQIPAAEETSPLSLSVFAICCQLSRTVSCSPLLHPSIFADVSWKIKLFRRTRFPSIRNTGWMSRYCADVTTCLVLSDVFLLYYWITDIYLWCTLEMMKCVSYTDSKQKCISETVTVKKWQRMEMRMTCDKGPQTDPRGTLQGFKTCPALISLKLLTPHRFGKCR